LIFRSLFWKLFLWFWFTAATIIGVQAVMIWFNDVETMPERVNRGPLGEGLTIFSETAAQAYERGGIDALNSLIIRTVHESGTEIYFYNGDGSPITAPGGDNVAEVVTAVQEAPPGQRVSKVFLGRSTWGKQVFGANGKKYIFIARFRAPGQRPPLFPPSRIIAMVLTAGLVCYLLALYLTSPVKKLQSTVKSFAEGNLDARVSPELGNRGDELAELGREFDRMAERIAGLISSQKRLLADISHELRSPLARLTVALELARKNSTPKADQALDRIEQETERVNQLVGQLLKLTRLESGAEEVPPEAVALEELVQQVIDDADFEAKALNKSVKAVRLEQCRVAGSVELLRSAVENVVRNAVRYTPQGSAVEVGLQWRLDTAVLTVRDHGPGVPQSELSHIFEPFYRVSEARERTSGGVGLGLSIAERTARLHGGTIRAENLPDGLLVTLELPLASTAAPSRSTPEPSPVHT
jgi:two-component system sensor histidine kinase CpxA